MDESAAQELSRREYYKRVMETTSKYTPIAPLWWKLVGLRFISGQFRKNEIKEECKH
jgi:hypothetical protein